MTGDFLDYMERLVDARALEDVWRLHRRGTAAFGFDRVIYGLTRVVGANGSLGDFDDALVLSNHDRAYNTAFISEQMFLDAPGCTGRAPTPGPSAGERSGRTSARSPSPSAGSSPSSAR
ncbi:MAG: autoinducer binding domain-containing protein [Paracoccaceae bacterium]